MTGINAFADTNVLIYLLSSDTAKADKAEAVLRTGCLISVQVLNEITQVSRRKLNMDWHDIDTFVSLIINVCTVEPLTVETYETGRYLAERYQLSVYDSMIVAAALIGKCEELYSEDMHHGLLIENTLRIKNPFIND
jgi:predicted nucleic acid-binding protein